MGRTSGAIEDPAPVTVAPGRCKNSVLMLQLGHQDVPFCDSRAARRVQVGLTKAQDVCLWHSLVAVNQFGGVLMRNWLRGRNPRRSP